jgi:hypothetical protein
MKAILLGRVSTVMLALMFSHLAVAALVHVESGFLQGVYENGLFICKGVSSLSLFSADPAASH